MLPSEGHESPVCTRLRRFEGSSILRLSKTNELFPSTLAANRGDGRRSIYSAVQASTNLPGTSSYRVPSLISTRSVFSASILSSEYPGLPGSKNRSVSAFLNSLRIGSRVRSTLVEANASSAGGGSMMRVRFSSANLISRSVQIMQGRDQKRLSVSSKVSTDRSRSLAEVQPDIDHCRCQQGTRPRSCCCQSTDDQRLHSPLRQRRFGSPPTPRWDAAPPPRP